MADDIRLEITADDSKSTQVLTRQQAHIAALERQVEQFEKRRTNAAKQTDDTGANAIGSVTQIASTFLKIGSIVQAASTMASLAAAEIDAAVARQDRAATYNLSLEDNERQLFNNIGRNRTDIGKTQAERNASGRRIASDLVLETGAAKNDATRVLGAAFSLAEGDDTSTSITEAARAALQAEPASKERQDGLVAASLGLRRGRQNITAEQAVGYALEAGAVLPIDNTAKAAALLNRSLGATEAYGGDEKLSAALAGAAATAGKDKEGDPTATFMVTFLESLSKSGTGKNTPLEQIEALQSRGVEFAKDREEFESLMLNSTKTEEQTRRLNQLKTKHAGFLKSTEHGEARFQQFQRSLLSGGESYKQLKSNLDTVPSFQESGPLFKERVAAVKVSPSVRLADDERRLQAGIDSESEANIGGAFASVWRKKLAEYADSTGAPAVKRMIDDKFADFEAWGDTRTEDEVRAEGKARLRALAEGNLQPEWYRDEEPSWSDLFTGKGDKPHYEKRNTDVAERIANVLERLDGQLDKGVRAKIKVARENEVSPPRAGQLQNGGGV